MPPVTCWVEIKLGLYTARPGKGNLQRFAIGGRRTVDGHVSNTAKINIHNQLSFAWRFAPVNWRRMNPLANAHSRLSVATEILMKSWSHPDLDGGIFSIAAPQFEKWVSAFAGAAKRTSDRGTALVETLPLFLKYKARRDLAEFILVNPKSPLLWPNSDPAVYARYWLVATGGSSSLEEAAAWVSSLIKDVGWDTLARAVRVARSHTSLGREMTGPWGNGAKDFLEHLTGRKDHWKTHFGGTDGMTAEESAKAPQSSIQNYQEPIFLARSLLAPFKEEPAVDQIRALVIQYIT
jgi:hypothetical protein